VLDNYVFALLLAACETKSDA